MSGAAPTGYPEGSGHAFDPAFAIAFALVLDVGVATPINPRRISTDPEGRRAWMPAVFRPSHGWRVEKSPRCSTPAREVCRGEPFLWLLSLGLAKKVTRLQAEALDVDLDVDLERIANAAASANGRQAKIKRFRLRRVTFFEGPKKVTKERPFPDKSDTWPAAGIGIFRLAIHGSVGKRRTSMCAAPSESVQGRGGLTGVATSASKARSRARARARATAKNGTSRRRAARITPGACAGSQGAPP